MNWHRVSLSVVVAVVVVGMAGVMGAQAWADEPRLAGQVSQHGITWTFADEHEVGQFVNGDWWVVGPVTVVEVDPAPGPAPEGQETQLTQDQWGNTGLQDDNRWRNGSMVVYRAENRQGYDSRGRNFNEDAVTRFPLELDPNRSLISTISHVELPNRKMHWELMWGSERNTHRVLRTAAVLTVVDEAPPADAFRPPYVGFDKPIFRAGDLQWDRLHELEAPDDVPAWSTIERYMERPWLDHMNGSWLARTIAPTENQPGYGREVGRIVSIASLMVHLDVPREQKETLLIRLVQYGIDLWGIAEAGGHWNEGGGHTSGRKWPILFAGLMLDDDRFFDLPATAVFQEDTQTYYGQGWHGQTALWQMVTHHGPREPYEHKHPDDWERWDRTSEGYRLCCTGRAWVGMALAARHMQAKRLWDHDAFFDYVDRFMADPDPYAEQRGEHERPSQEASTFDPFVDAMWRMHREAAPAEPYGDVHRMWDAQRRRWVQVTRPQ